MDKTTDGNVRDIPKLLDSPGSLSSSIPSSVGLPTNDMMDTLISASLLRGDIRVKLSTKFKVGYEIRPIMWFVKKTPEIQRTLNKIGIEYREIFVTTSDLTKLCHAFKPYFNASNMSDGLNMVNELNGVLPQPLTYEEVDQALKQIEKQGEALRPQPASVEPQRSERI